MRSLRKRAFCHLSPDRGEISGTWSSSESTNFERPRGRGEPFALNSRAMMSHNASPDGAAQITERDLSFTVEKRGVCVLKSSRFIGSVVARQSAARRIESTFVNPRCGERRCAPRKSSENRRRKISGRLRARGASFQEGLLRSGPRGNAAIARTSE